MLFRSVSFFDGDAGLMQFSDKRAGDPEVLKLAKLINYEIDPENEYPRNYTGHIKVELRSGELSRSISLICVVASTSH